MSTAISIKESVVYKGDEVLARVVNDETGAPTIVSEKQIPPTFKKQIKDLLGVESVKYQIGDKADGAEDLGSGEGAAGGGEASQDIRVSLYPVWGDKVEENLNKVAEVAELADIDPENGLFQNIDFLVALFNLWDHLFGGEAAKRVGRALEAGPTGIPPSISMTTVESEEVSNSNDPEPIQDVRFGDLTPVWVEWFRRNNTPVAFNEKYARRGII